MTPTDRELRATLALDRASAIADLIGRLIAVLSDRPITLEYAVRYIGNTPEQIRTALDAMTAAKLVEHFCFEGIDVWDLAVRK